MQAGQSALPSKPLSGPSMGSNSQTAQESSMLARVTALTRHITATTTSSINTRSMATSTSADPRWKQLIGQNIAKAFKEGEKSSVCEYSNVVAAARFNLFSP